MKAKEVLKVLCGIDTVLIIKHDDVEDTFTISEINQMDADTECVSASTLLKKLADRKVAAIYPLDKCHLFISVY
jgi:hypothetical protein